MNALLKNICQEVFGWDALQNQTKYLEQTIQPSHTSAAKYTDALEYISKVIPWFSPSTQEYSMDELNKQVVLVNLWVVTKFEYIKNGGDTLLTMEEIKKMVQKAKQAATYEIEMREKASKIKESGNGDKGKKNKQSKDGKRNRKHQYNNKLNPC